MTNHAYTQRPRGLDGRGNLSTRALREFTAWFFRVCKDQIEFMTGQFEFKSLSGRRRSPVEATKELPGPSGATATDGFAGG